jgi:hypothetical protein
MLYQSFREKGSTVFFFRPFLPLLNLLFCRAALVSLRAYNLEIAQKCTFPTAISCQYCARALTMRREIEMVMIKLHANGGKFRVQRIFGAPGLAQARAYPAELA